MNQTQNNNNSTKKEIHISIISLIAVIIVFIIILMSIYKIFFNNKTEASDNIDNDDILISETTNIEDEKTKENQEKNIANSDIEVNENDVSTDNVITYTAPNGETYNIIGTLNIPSLQIEYPILSSTSEALLKISLTRYWGANPNKVGNMVVLGHNYKNSKFFGKLPNIEMGSIIKITDVTGKTLDYKVYKTDIIDPSDNSYTSQLTDGNIEITLITCYYEKGHQHSTKRFVVKARVI